MHRSDLEAAGIIEPRQRGDKAWSNFGRDMDTFILKLPESRRAALAAVIRSKAGVSAEFSH